MKQYTIKEVSKLMSLPSSTIRYYDREGLLPFMQRNESGYRLFSENDIATLKTIDCLKKTGMAIKEIKLYMQLVQQGDSTLKERYELFLERKKAVITQMEDLNKTLAHVNYKCELYEKEIFKKSV